MKARVPTLCVKPLSYFPHDSSPLLQRSTSERSCMIERDIMTLLPCKSPSHEHFTSESPFVNWSPTNWLSDPMATIQIEGSSTFVWKKWYFVLGDIFGGTLAITTLLPFEIRIPMAWCHNPLCLPHSSGMYPSVLLGSALMTKSSLSGGSVSAAAAPVSLAIHYWWLMWY